MFTIDMIPLGASEGNARNPSSRRVGSTKIGGVCITDACAIYFQTRTR